MTNTTTPASTGAARAVTSMRNRQGIRDEVARHTPSPEAQAMMASMSAKSAKQKQPTTSNEALTDPLGPMADALEGVLQKFMAT